MKSFGEIMKELGFNENAPESVQKAFFQHMAQQAENLKPRTPITDQGPAPTKLIEPKKNEQLSMDFAAVDSIVCTYKNKKVS